MNHIINLKKSDPNLVPGRHQTDIPSKKKLFFPVSELITPDSPLLTFSCLHAPSLHLTISIQITLPSNTFFHPSMFYRLFIDWFLNPESSNQIFHGKVVTQFLNRSGNLLIIAYAFLCFLCSIFDGILTSCLMCCIVAPL